MLLLYGLVSYIKHKITRMTGRSTYLFSILKGDSMKFLLSTTAMLALILTKVQPFRQWKRSIYGQAFSTRSLSPSAVRMSTDDALESFQKHQSSVKRLSVSEEIRTLVQQSTGYAVLSTNSVQYPGFPTGSIAGFSIDKDGKPFFVLSAMSAHTKDILVDGRSSLCVTSKNFKDAADGRVTLIGTISKLPQDKIQAYREEYLKKHKDAYWIDFGDFSYFTMDKIDNIRYIGGFARAGSISGSDYLNCSPDPLAAFAEPVMNHMNDDHADSTVAMIKHYVGVEVTDAKIIGLDKYGMTIKAKLEIADGEYSNIRLPFPREITERKGVKEAIVEMTRASAPSS